MTFKFLQKKSVDATHDIETVEKVTTDTKSEDSTYYSCEQLAHLTFDVSRKAHTVLTNPDHPHTKSLRLSQDTFARRLHRDCGRGDSHTKNLFTGVCKKTNMFSDSTCEQFHSICDEKISATYSTDDQERTKDDNVTDAICSALKKIHNDGPVRLNSSEFYERKIPIQLDSCAWYDIGCHISSSPIVKIIPPPPPLPVIKKIMDPKTYTDPKTYAGAAQVMQDGAVVAEKATSNALDQAGKSISEAFKPPPCENECGCGTLAFDTDTPDEWIAKLWECQDEFDDRGKTKNYTSALGIIGSMKNKTCVLAGEAALSAATKGKSDFLEGNACGVISVPAGLLCEGIGQAYFVEEGPAGEAALGVQCAILGTAFNAGCEALFDAVGIKNDFTDDKNWNKILKMPSLLIQTICNATGEAPEPNSFYPCINRKKRC